MKKLLLVENDLVVLKVWNKYFAREYEVFLAEHVPEAKEILNTQPIDMIILDLRLNGPTPNGLEIYHYVRETLQSNIPITFVTGFTSGTELYNAAEILTEKDIGRGKFTRLIEKPIEIEPLLQIVLDMSEYEKASQNIVYR
jgi:CheY-like chemotaxis protein